MKGICFQDVLQVAVCDLPDPEIELPTDAIVQIRLAGLCGSDLHPFFGNEVGIDAGTVMGHEFVGEVVAVGNDVQQFRVGDQVCAPFTTNCGQCFYCRQGLTSRCQQGQLFGWREHGQGLHGGQASLVRVPLADGTMLQTPDGTSDETALLLGDNLSTGHFAAKMAEVGPEGTYVVVGCGTVGLLAIASAQQLGAETVIAIDPNETRLQTAQQLGAATFSTEAEAAERIAEQTDGRGADGVIELVGSAAAQRTAYDLVRPGGTIAAIGCNCERHFSFSPAAAYDKNLTFRTGRCPARHYMDHLANELVQQPMDLTWCITHQFAVDDGEQAYDVFANRKDGCIKAAIQFDA